MTYDNDFDPTTDEDFTASIARALNDAGIASAESSSTGGGFYNVFISIDQSQYCFGANGDHWEADVTYADTLLESLSVKTPVLSTEQDASKVAAGILTGILAYRFNSHLSAQVGIENMALIRERNRYQEDTNVCHSHDVCDANMMMIAAFGDLGIATTFNPADDKHASVWNDAWDYAKKQYLTLG